MNLRDKLAARLLATTQNPLETAAKFFRIYFSDAEGLDDARAHLTRMAGINQRTLTEGLAAIEALLADPPAAGTLSQLVALEANWPLDDPSDAGAKIFLREIADLIGEVLAASEGSTRSTTPPKNA